MKKILIPFLVVLIGGCLYCLYQLRIDYSNNQYRQVSRPTVIAYTPIPTVSATKRFIFVPSWSDFSEVIDNNYDRYIYFGITATEQGINKNDSSYQNIEKFISQIDKTKEKYLTVKMTDLETNIVILKNKDSWEKIIKDSLDIVNNYQFNGIVLDLEISTLPLIDISDQINQFVKHFYSQTRGSYKLALTVYGDNFYRKRPYDLETLSQNCDEVIIMAYDFSKSYGEPGPNFPFAASAKYDYDFQKMIADFSHFVPRNQLSVIFGMYGYDWQVDEKKRPVKPAEALTLNQIKKKFIEKCQWQDCVVKRDKQSKETEVNYVISEIKDNFAYMYYHVVWFEDEQSAKIKTDYLKQQGIGSIGYWAYGYF